MTRRADQIASTLDHALREVIARGFQDPRLDGVLLTLTGLRVSPDLVTAIASVSVFPEKKESAAMHALEHASRHIRREIGDLVALKRVPALKFELDRSLKHEARVLEALAKVAREREQQATDRSDELPAQEQGR